MELACFFQFSSVVVFTASTGLFHPNVCPTPPGSNVLLGVALLQISDSFGVS